MNQLPKTVFLLCCFAFFTLAGAQDTLNDAIAFEPPEGWRCADPKQLPKSVKVMVIGETTSNYPPSNNLGIESFAGSLEDYLKIVKAINDSQKAEWKNLGTIHTKAGSANLSQVDMNTSWGSVRLLHTILVKDGQAYIMTAAARRDDFPKYYRTFFTSMRSLHFREVDEQQSALLAP